MTFQPASQLTYDTLHSRPQGHLALVNHLHEEISLQQVELLDQLLLLTLVLQQSSTVLRLEHWQAKQH